MPKCDATVPMQKEACGRWITTERIAVSGFRVIIALHYKNIYKNFSFHCSMIKFPAFPIGRDDDGKQADCEERW